MSSDPSRHHSILMRYPTRDVAQHVLRTPTNLSAKTESARRRAAPGHATPCAARRLASARSCHGATSAVSWYCSSRPSLLAGCATCVVSPVQRASAQAPEFDLKSFFHFQFQFKLFQTSKFFINSNIYISKISKISSVSLLFFVLYSLKI
jgi:hypothetical protein